METKDFYSRVYEVVAQIPEGKVCTYGAIAGYLGVKSGSRMVGYALNNYNSGKFDFYIPAHRVVNRLGQLTGRAHFPGNSMKERLEQDGINFVEEFTIDIKRHFWDPNKEYKL